jgi:tRNA pseudouridine32 synthase/23S rRNA pseudouridine746 synthase
VVVNKPSGLLSVPGRTPDLQDCLWNRLKDQFPDREILLVHRLDRDTSGLIVFAHTHEAQVALGRAFEKRKVRKEYVAWVRGTLKEDSGKVEGLMRKDWTRFDMPVYLLNSERGKPSLTYFEVLERESDRTKVRLKPHTGRSHQLRVHMESLGHPIKGDPIYGPEGDGPPLCLVAVRLKFCHPVLHNELVLCIPLPDYM